MTPRVQRQQDLSDLSPQRCAAVALTLQAVRRVRGNSIALRELNTTAARFQFPLKDSKRLMQWLKAVQRDNWTPTKYSFLCSEHFTKDSFSKRLEDQHRLLKPTAVPSIFHLAEKKRGAGGHGRPRRRDTGKASAGLRAQASDPVDGKAAAGSPSSSSASPMAKPEPRKLKRATPQGRTEDGPPRRQRPGGQERRFRGRLHAPGLRGLFSSKHARERPAVPREPVERKRLRRDAEPGCSGSSPGPEKGPAQSPPRACPSASSSLTATPQKPAQGASAPPTDVTPKPAAEAVQSEHSDASPMSINEVILSASGACKLIDSLHSYCFSSRQSKSQVCCLREQVEKKNGELRTLRQRVSRSDSQVRELRQKLDQLRRLSLPHLSSLLPPGRGQYPSPTQGPPCAVSRPLRRDGSRVAAEGSADSMRQCVSPILQNTHDSSRATGAAVSGSGKLAPEKLLLSGVPTERALSPSPGLL
nr:PREDICTED: THAP domain-containing protein 4-like [Bos mutus]